LTDKRLPGDAACGIDLANTYGNGNLLTYFAPDRVMI
jgi:hypothetical protein